MAERNRKSGRPKLGRQKIEIKKIINEEARQVCFSKRRHGLIKKAGELCILCGTQVAIIVFSPAGKAFSYGDPSVDSVIKRFTNGSSSRIPAPPDGHRVSSVQELHGQLDNLVQQMKVEKTRRLELQKLQLSEECSQIGRFWDADVDSLSPEQLEEFMTALEEMRFALIKRTNELILGMAPVQHNHHPFLRPSVASSPSPVSTSSIAPLPSNSFLSGYNPTIPFSNNINVSMGTSSRPETIPNSSQYFFNNQFAGHPFFRL